MAALGLAIGAGALFQTTLLTRTIVAVGSENVGCGIANVGLTKSCDEAVRRVGAGLDRVLKHPCGNALVVSRRVGVVSQQRGAMNGKPGQYANVLVVLGSLEAKQRHGSVCLVLVLFTLRFGIRQVGVQGAVDCAVFNPGATNVQIALRSSQLPSPSFPLPFFPTAPLLCLVGLAS